jgi:saccharopine dehydrogenase-like NADP-dependent oxidoreductase
MADKGVTKELILCDVIDTEAFTNILVSQDVDLVVNAGSTYCNEPVLNGCLQAGVSYIDASCAERPGESNAAAPWYQPGLFTEPFSAGGFWRFQGPGRAHSGVPSGIG